MNKKPLRYICLLLSLFLFFPVLHAQRKNFTVVIDAGHGGKDPGAKGTTTKEKDINLAVALKLGNLIENNHNDVRVIYTRKNDRFVELDERANIANNNKANLFISIHTNALPKKSAHIKGTETYTLGLARNDENLTVAMRENSAILLEDNYKQRYEGFDPNSSESYIIFEFIQNNHVTQSVNLASEVQKCFTAAKRNNRGVRQAGFLVLRKTSMPSILIELGYISNREEERFMSTDQGKKQLATAIYNAFTKYKHEYDRRQGFIKGRSKAAPILQYTAEELPPASTPASQKSSVGATTDAPPPGSEADILSRKQNASSSANKQGEVVYKIQILTAPQKLPANSRRLKGYKDVSYFVENGIYKYTYGESKSFNTISKLRRSILKDFKDSFIIVFKDGEKVQ